MVERCVRDAEVAGSNPVASTLGRGAGAFGEIQMFRFFLLKRKKLRSGRRGPQGPVDLGIEPTEAEAETAGSNPVASTLGRGAGAFEEIQMFRFFIVF